MTCILATGCTLADRPAAPQAPPVHATRTMAATANPRASQAALTILRQGGSAVDAAIAAQMMLGVVEPQASGLGGGSALLVWDGEHSRLHFYDGLALAPADVPADYAHDAAGHAWPKETVQRSGRVVGVPGTLRTMALLHRRYGRLPWDRLFQDAIGAARDGFALSPYLHLVLTERPELARLPQFAAYFDAAGKPLAVGTMLKDPALAATLALIAREGDAPLYDGILGEHLRRAVDTGPLPGRISRADLSRYRVRERTPLCITAFGRRICSAAPPVAGGLSVLQQLAILDRVGIARYQPGSVQAAHFLLEASRLAEADRRRYAADPDFVPVPTDALLDPAYLDARARLIAPDHAAATVRPGTIDGRQAMRPASDPMALPATSHIAIRDAAGNAVSFTTTINLNFGSDLVSDGMVLNNAITNFATRPRIDGQVPANAASPGKRPTTTMSPTIVFGPDGQPEIIIGAGGGARIIDSVVQTLVGRLAWGMSIRDAIDQPRIGAQNHAEELERGSAAERLAPMLEAMGHKPKIDIMNAAVQAVVVTPRGLEGWADPHRDGVAMGD
ncbi:gamma-glutamyltransferase [Gluconacetobacter sacchari]|uniref:gamma-glutamyltransferase n=1 Tax=Gluconacetobacter sacchari TaxID=92759 RepID=UPI0039B42627